jgi:hypothetical protein
MELYPAKFVNYHIFLGLYIIYCSKVNILSKRGGVFMADGFCPFSETKQAIQDYKNRLKECDRTFIDQVELTKKIYRETGNREQYLIQLESNVSGADGCKAGAKEILYAKFEEIVKKEETEPIKCP